MPLTPRQVEAILAKAGVNEINFFEKTLNGNKFDRISALLDKGGVDAHHFISLYDEQDFPYDNNEPSEWTPKGELMDMSWEEFIGSILGTHIGGPSL